MDEIELTGGRITAGVVRVGDTVRRPRNERSPWIAGILEYLEEAGYPYAPRFRGIDDCGRDILTYIPGATTDHPSQRQADAYRRGGQMLRALHDVTRGYEGGPCVVHGDPGAYNTVFVGGLPVAFIDWDAAHRGDPVEDLEYMAWTWCIQSVGNVPIADQALHLHELGVGYDVGSIGVTDSELLSQVIAAQGRLIESEQHVLGRPTTTRKRKDHAKTAIAWATADRDLIRRERAAITHDLGRL